ncbi:lipocalin family protein [Actimicrobium antarcticum]|uniref:Outer membrane lipoprotein Blc n=1 Tax=Actimicrobium antarcticum TaxID=1051899 RepID=A0ABP7T352_9BURK
MSHFYRTMVSGLAPLLLMVQLGSAGAQTVTPVTELDLNRYAGKWVEIARLPNKFQKDCVSNVTANYVKRSDGEIDVINRCKKANGAVEEAVGRARIPNLQMTSKLKVRFAPQWLSWLPMVWADYWVVDLSTDYSLAAVGGPTHEYLWILARSPEVAEPSYQALLQRLTAQGFDTAKLVRTLQDSSK